MVYELDNKIKKYIFWKKIQIYMVENKKKLVKVAFFLESAKKLGETP